MAPDEEKDMPMPEALEEVLASIFEAYLRLLRNVHAAYVKSSEFQTLLEDIGAYEPGVRELVGLEELEELTQRLMKECAMPDVHMRLHVPPDNLLELRNQAKHHLEVKQLLRAEQRRSSRDRRTSTDSAVSSSASRRESRESDRLSFKSMGRTAKSLFPDAMPGSRANSPLSMRRTSAFALKRLSIIVG